MFSKLYKKDFNLEMCEEKEGKAVVRHKSLRDLYDSDDFNKSLSEDYEIISTNPTLYVVKCTVKDLCGLNRSGIGIGTVAEAEMFDYCDDGKVLNWKGMHPVQYAQLRAFDRAIINYFCFDNCLSNMEIDSFPKPELIPAKPVASELVNDIIVEDCSSVIEEYDLPDDPIDEDVNEQTEFVDFVMDIPTEPEEPEKPEPYIPKAERTYPNGDKVYAFMKKKYPDKKLVEVAGENIGYVKFFVGPKSTINSKQKKEIEEFLAAYEK